MSEDAPGAGFRCGTVAVVGRPNVGKSTLVNRLVGQKLSITSRRAQTTRHRIVGIRTTDEAQILYVDTPGLHTGEHRALNRYMNRVARGALLGVDVVVLVIEASGWREEDADVLGALAECPAPVLLAINKVDRLADKGRLLPLIAQMSELGRFEEVVPVSARRPSTLGGLEAAVVSRLPLAPPAFPADQITDRSERFLAAELIREKLIRRLGDELPHRLAVEIEHFRDEAGRTEIGAIIWVERDGQKAIVIGRGGAQLKVVGTEARRDIEVLLGRSVFLQLWVKVKAGWSDDERSLGRMGLDD